MYGDGCGKAAYRCGHQVNNFTVFTFEVEDSFDSLLGDRQVFVEMLGRVVL